MENRINQMEIAKVSSKGQLVIPKSFRKKFDIKQGNMFALASINKTLGPTTPSRLSRPLIINNIFLNYFIL